MKRSLLALASMLLLCLGTTNAQNNTTAQTVNTVATYAKDLLQPGTIAPNFSLKTYDNRTIRLSDFRGKYLVIDFWASWCPDCRKDIPAMKELYSKYSTQGVNFLGISFDTDKERWAKTYWGTYQMAWTQVSELKKWKKGSVIDQLYKVNWIPLMYLINPNGKIILGTTEVTKLKETLESINTASVLNNNSPKAQFKGGQRAFDDYTIEHLKGVFCDKKANVKADLVVRFTVMFDGQVTGAHVVKVKNVEASGSQYNKMTQAKRQAFIAKRLAEYKKEAVRFMTTKTKIAPDVQLKHLWKKPWKEVGMPLWEPATVNGKPIQTNQTVTLNFGCL